MYRRREILKTGAAVCMGMYIPPLFAHAAPNDIAAAKDHLDPGMNRVIDGVRYAKKGRLNNIPPVLREEILDNPRAVFVVKTGVVSEKDKDGKFPADTDQFMREGHRVASCIFRPGTKKGGQTYIKPNYVGGFSADPRSVNNGVSTHPAFVAGFCDALREIGNTNIVVGANGAAKHEDFVNAGIAEMMHEHKVCFTEGKYEKWEDYISDEIVWVKNPDGVVMRKIPFFKLVQAKDTTFINMAKDRIHQLGFTTLTMKNLQGVIPVGYMHICQPWNDLKKPMGLEPGRNVFNKNYQRDIEKLYIKHANMNFKYWDEGGFAKAYFDAGGWNEFVKNEKIADYKLFWSEQWGQRMMDICSSVHPCVNLVEGIVGIDGANALHLNNFVTVSRSMVECDSVAAWLMGHDPRELPFLRIANERGLGNNDINRIAVYELSEKGIEKIDYRTLPRANMGVNVYGLKDMPLRFF